MVGHTNQDLRSGVVNVHALQDGRAIIRDHSLLATAHALQDFILHHDLERVLEDA